MSTMRRILAAIASVALAMALVAPGVAPTANAADCRYVLGFAALHALIPKAVGQCLEDEQHNPTNGDGLQHTTGGLLVWRKADNWTAFTDGYHTWVNGPKGLEYRLNTQRFAWEANPEGLPVVPDFSYGVAQNAPSSGLRLRDVGNALGSAQGPLLFRVAGSGFASGEAVTVQGTYTPLFTVSTGNPESPVTQRTCTPEALGPIEVTADDSGSFSATLRAPHNLHTGGEAKITAAGARSGPSGVLGVVDPQGARVAQLPDECRA